MSNCLVKRVSVTRYYDICLDANSSKSVEESLKQAIKEFCKENPSFFTLEKEVLAEQLTGSYRTTLVKSDALINLVIEEKVKPDHEKCRKLFEKIYIQNKQAARRNEHGDYVLPLIQDAWSGWLYCYLHLAELTK